MKRDKMYTWPCWRNNRWEISIDPQRWTIGFWWTSFTFGITIGCLEITFLLKEKDK